MAETTLETSFDEMVSFTKKLLKLDLLLEEVKLGISRTAEDDFSQCDALEEAAKNPDTNGHDMLITLAVEYLRSYKSMPCWMAHYVADFLEGKRKRPTPKGPDPYKNFPRDFQIFTAVRVVSRKFNLPFYTNNELSNKLTAAAIVSEASGYNGSLVIGAFKRMKKVGEKKRS